MTINKLAVHLGITNETLRLRCIRSKIPIHKGKVFNDEEIHIIESVNNKKEKPCKIVVLELYFTLKNNSVRNVALYLKISEKYIHTVLNEWLENGNTITIKSKL